MKFAVILVLAAVACRWAFGRWPWDYLRGASGDRAARQRAQRLLGIDAKADRERIREAHRRLAADLHPDRGGSNARLAEINAARDLLLSDPPSASQDNP